MSSLPSAIYVGHIVVRDFVRKYKMPCDKPWEQNSKIWPYTVPAYCTIDAVLSLHTGIRKSRSGREAKAEHVEKDGGFIGMKADADVEKDGKFVGMYITLRYILYALESTK